MREWAVENLYYAGSHGFDIDGPGGLRKQVKTSAVPILRAARSQLEVWLRDVAARRRGQRLLRVDPLARRRRGRPARGGAVDAVLALAPFGTTLRKFSGKCVFELRPSAAWNKGEAALCSTWCARPRAARTTGSTARPVSSATT